MKRISLFLLTLMALTFASGCSEEAAESLLGLAKSLGFTADIAGEVDIEGADLAPTDLTIKLYAWSENKEAFDESACEGYFAAQGSASSKLAALQDDDDDDDNDDNDDGASGSAEGEFACYGSLELDGLTQVVQVCEDYEEMTGCEPYDVEENIETNDNRFTLSEVPLDLAFIMIVSYEGGDYVCNEDIIGYNDQDDYEGPKIVDSAHAIGPQSVGDIVSSEWKLPRNIKLSCSAVPVADPEVPASPEPPDPPAVVVPDDPPEESILPEPPPEPVFTEFYLSAKGDLEPMLYPEVTGDENNDVCSPPSPNIYEVHALSDSETAFLMMQFGAGEDAVVQKIQVNVIDGVINHPISLPGGYVALMLDADGIVDDPNDDSSAVIELCVAETPPAQELLVLMSWDTEGDDVDLHAYNGEGEHVWYANKNASFAWLDIDDTSGLGPETITSTGGPDAGETYLIKVHYYSDHGTGNVPNTTVRVVYWNPAPPDGQGNLCDFTTTVSLNNYEWKEIGLFGPGVPCPE